MKCLRIYADETGESHLADIDIPLVPTKVFPGVPALDLSDRYTATSVRFAWVPAGMRVAGWHTTPVRQLVVWLTGWVEFETSDGETRRCEPGAVVLAEDTFGKGHISRHPDEGQFLMFTHGRTRSDPVSVPIGFDTRCSYWRTANREFRAAYERWA